MAGSPLATLGRKRALDVLDLLDGREDGARFGEIQRYATNGVPSAATGLLTALEECGAIARDTAKDNPRYRLTSGGKVARVRLHQVVEALGGQPRIPRTQTRRPPREGDSDGRAPRVAR